MDNKPNRLEVLQALRAIAAAMVVFVHAIDTYIVKVAAVGEMGLHYGLGGFGVKLFFCISGYIIFASSTGLAPGWGASSFFARRRLIRIVPLYWCATLIYAAKLWLQGDMPSGLDMLRSLFFIPFTNEYGLMRPVLGPGWTLNFELLFYTALCLTLVLERAWRLPAVAALFVAALTARALGMTPTSYPAGSTAWGLMIDPLLLFFLAGMLIGTANRQWGGKLGYLPKTFAGGMGLVLLLLAAFVVPASVYGLGVLGGQESVTSVALELLVCAALVFLSVQSYASVQTGAYSRMRHWLVLAGDGSFSTYLIHGFVMGPAARVLDALQWHPSPWLFAMAMVVLCTAVGMLVYKYFEHPLLTRMNSRWGRPSHTRLPSP